MADRNLNLAVRVTADTKEGRAALAELQKSMVATGKGSGSALDPFTRSLAEATGGVSSLQTALKPLNAALAAIGGVISVSLLTGMVRGFANLSRELTALASVSNTGVEEFQGLAYAAQTVGVGQEKLGDIFKDTQDKIGDFLNTGGGELLDFFQKVGPQVGVTAEQFRGLSGPDALQLYVSSLEKANLSQSEMTFYLEAIADDSARLLPVLRHNGAAMRALAEEGRALGAIIGADLVRQGVVLERNLQMLEARGKGLAIAIGSVLVPALNELAEGLLELVRTDMSVFDRLFGTFFRGFDDPSKSPAEEIARLKREIEDFQNGGWSERSLLGNLVPEKVLADLEQQLAFWVRKREEAARPSAEEQKAQRERLELETSLANEMARLEKLRAVAAGQANADILLDDKALQRKRIEEARKATTEQLSGAERLRDALRSAWQASIDGARQARQEAEELFKQADAAAQSRQQQAQDRRDRDLAPEERDARNTRSARNLTDEAITKSVFAQNAAIDGRAEVARRYAEEALKLAEQAADYVEGIGDNDTAAELLSRLGEAEKAALEAQGRLRQQEGGEQAALGQAIEQQIQRSEQRIAGLKAELEKPVTIALDITEAEAKIAGLQKRLAELNAQSGGAPQASAPGELKDAAPGGLEPTKNVEITAETSAADEALAKVAAAVDAIPEEKTVVVKTITSSGDTVFSDGFSDTETRGYATGGAVRGPGTSTSDSILARLSDGEFVLRAAAVRRYGIDFLHALNSMSMPRFAGGGLVSQALQPALAESGGPAMAPANLVVPGVGQWPIQTSADVQSEIIRVFSRAALQRGRRG